MEELVFCYMPKFVLGGLLHGVPVDLAERHCDRSPVRAQMSRSRGSLPVRELRCHEHAAAARHHAMRRDRWRRSICLDGAATLKRGLFLRLSVGARIQRRPKFNAKAAAGSIQRRL
jgi:hypothetical protein